MTGVDDTIAASPGTAGAPRREHGDGLAPGDVVGRYVVLSRIGAGGMGIVYVAYDPELDRKVALKLLQTIGLGEGHTEGRRRLAREAQAMARLRHPNVVVVHDVGEHAAQVFVAMEFVAGRTLGAWMNEAPRPWPAVLEAFVAAGRGLAAAHEQGLVHRDFKPDNVMVGDDDRVQVMDFGLARPTGAARVDHDVTPLVTVERLLDSGVTNVGSIVGTPAYMAPEQHAGLEVGTAADQFSFCVALWEALYGERPFAGASLPALVMNVVEGNRRPPPPGSRVPAWLRRACERGLVSAPERRFASMAVLLQTLERGRSRARVRRAAIGLGVIAVLAAGAEASRRYGRARTIAACEAEGERIAEVWNADVRASVRAALLATGTAYAEATATSALAWIDLRADEWNEQRTHACLRADIEREWDARTLDRARWCLDDLHTQMGAHVEQLQRVDASTIRHAAPSASRLAPAQPCVDELALARSPEPPRAELRAAVTEVRGELSRAHAMYEAGKYDEALAEMIEVVESAAAIDWPPLLAAARLEHGVVLGLTGAYAEAEAITVAAYMDAAKAGDWALAEAAATALVLNVGYEQARHAEGRLWAGNAEVAASHAADPSRLREAARKSYLGVVHEATGDHERARALLEEAVAIQREALGPSHPALSKSLHNLAIVHHAVGDFAGQKALEQEALAIQEEALGGDHPDVAVTLSSLGVAHMRLDELAEAKAMQQRALVIRERAFGPEHAEIAASLTNLANVHTRLGEHHVAKAMHERALAIRETALGPRHPEVAATLENLAFTLQRLGASDQAEPLVLRALAILEAVHGPDHLLVAKSLDNLVSVLTTTGEYARARGFQERALAIHRATQGRAHADVASSIVRLADLDYYEGDYEGAKERYEVALTLTERALGPMHPASAVVWFSLGDALGKLGRHDEAVNALERALVIYDAHPSVQSSELATKLTLASELLASGGDPARARGLVEAARDGWLAGHDDGHRTRVAEAQAWLAEHEGL